MRDEPKKTKRDWSVLIPIVSVAGPILVVLGGAFYEEVLPHLHGATPQQLASVQLGSPKQVGHDLPMTSVKYGHEVEVKLRKGVCHPYEEAELDWAKKSLDAPETMRLRAEHDHESTNGATVTAALRRHIHGFRASHTWGPVSVNVSGNNGDIWFTVSHYLSSGARNPLFDCQLEAARELVLNAALNVPIQVSDRELADVLGTGYPTAQLAQLDPGVSVESAPTVLHQLFPGAVPYGSGAWNVALDHPLVSSIELSWSNRPGGRLTSLSFTITDAYPASRAVFESCLEKQVGPPTVHVTDYAAGKKDYSFAIGSIVLILGGSGIDARSTIDPMNAGDFAHLFRALDACRESNESTGGGHGDTR